MNSFSQQKSSQLYLASVTDIKEYPSDDVKLWSSFYDRVVSHNVPLVDRSEKIIMPYRFKLYEPFRMPQNLEGFNLSYEDCCLDRARELLARSRTLNKPILLFYSGGIDSTIVAISFIRAAEGTDLRQQIKIAMTPESIIENPNFYYQHIRPNFSLVSSEQFNHLLTEDYIIVGGEHNDQLFGSDIVGKIDASIGFDRVLEDYKQGMLRDWFLRNGMTDQQANFWFDMLVWHAESAPCEIRTSFDLLWWLNFNFKWQSVFFRMLLRISPQTQHRVNDQWIADQFHHFYSSENFQKWSMLNPQLKIKNSWRSYKFHAKDFIYKFTSDVIYKNEKLKKGSLFKLFLSRRTPLALTTDWQYLYQLDPASLYQSPNNFQGNQLWNT
jgi:hypothetical protein